jgi:transcriptional regulator with XRE-family HTH domain
MGEEDRMYGMTSDSTIEIEAADPTYAVKVGSRLRAIRKQKRLSLQEVEASSGQEFKASVLGAYERGERAISVPRLQRLARFYNVPVDQLLPRDDADLGPDSVIDLERGAVLAARSNDDGPVTLDLVRLESLGTPEAQVLGRYLGMIQVQRGDFNGRMLTVRRDDLRAIACLLDASPDAARQRLDELRLREAGLPRRDDLARRVLRRGRRAEPRARRGSRPRRGTARPTSAAGAASRSRS